MLKKKKKEIEKKRKKKKRERERELNYITKQKIYPGKILRLIKKKDT